MPVGRVVKLLVLIAIIVGISWLAVVNLGAKQATEQLVNALTRGSIYALIAIGYTMMYGIIELINFAHGDMFMVGAFVSLSFLTQLGFTGAVTDPRLLIVLLVASFAVTMGVLALVGMTIERAWRTGRCATRHAWPRSSRPSACRSSCRTRSSSSTARTRRTRPRSSPTPGPSRSARRPSRS
ncbi:MAG TPA: hypothetical protein VIK13_05800 [Candidatus Limnocylindrales bacterium]